MPTKTKKAPKITANAPKTPPPAAAAVLPPGDQDANLVARDLATKAQEAKVEEIKTRKLYVKGCQSCENYKAGHADALTCGHDKKKE